MTPFLMAIQLVFLLGLASRQARVDPAGLSMRPVYLLVLWLAAFGVLTSVLGARDVYLSEALLATLPGLWLPGVVVVAAVLPVSLFGALRDGLRAIVDHTPWHWFAFFHGLRIAAIGTAYRTAIGEFPPSFEYGVGVPDLLFGVSALWIGMRAKRGQLSERAFLIWNLIGVGVIVPAAPILLQLGLPGPIQVFTSIPDARAVLTYPMSIAPLMCVPLFVLANLWLAWRLLERRSAPSTAQT